MGDPIIDFMVTFTASPALYEPGGPLAGSDQPDELTLGPFPCDKVMLTYTMLRVGEEGKEVAWIVDELWRVGTQRIPQGNGWEWFGPSPDAPMFSDVVIYAKEPA